MAIVIPASSLFAQDYQPLEIINIQPKEILPIVGQVEEWDKKVYNHIEHLRIAEATRIRDMMWEYGAGNHNAEEYKQLMNRLNTWMIWENPKWYNNYETIWWSISTEPSYHAHNERNILNTIINHANYKIIDSWDINHRFTALQEIIRSTPNDINIFWNSMSIKVNKGEYNNIDIETFKKICKAKNLLLFFSWWNIEEMNWILKNKIYHENVNGDNHWVYSLSSSTNWKNDAHLDKHLIVTIWSNSKWDIDQTNEDTSWSKCPVWFHDKVLFAWRAFPYLSWSTNKVSGSVWKYTTSYTNYVNLAVADLCFQMFAEVKDVDTLLEMIRSTSLTDYIRFDLNGDGDTDDIVDGQPESQPLILINPAGFFLKYLMPTTLPTNIKTNETIALDKGYYHGVIYQIPGTEVNINGQWIAFTDNNKDLILAQNPMTLEWRLNGELLNKYGYKPGDTIKGQILVVDDQWNGLNITKDFSVSIEAGGPDAIHSTVLGLSAETWYTVDGLRLDAKPTKPGVYVVNGQKVIVK